jgi:2'-5' RNA ligase
MIDRWEHRADPAPGEATVYWHMLMRDYPQAVSLAREAQQRLAHIDGLHMTPLQWLHMTTMVAGPASEFTINELDRMAAAAADLLASMPPITVTLGRVLHHPEAIMLGVTPREALKPIRNATLAATRLVTGRQALSDGGRWVPHITICYSTAHQSAAPIFAALGESLTPRDIQVNALSLVIQHGPERNWNWSPTATIRLATNAMTQVKS